MSGRPYTIIGIASNRFKDTDALVRIDAYVPAWRLDDFREVPGTSSILNDRSFRQFTVLGRLKPGVSLEQARSALEIRNASITREYASSADDLPLRLRTRTKRSLKALPLFCDVNSRSKEGNFLAKWIVTGFVGRQRLIELRH